MFDTKGITIETVVEARKQKIEEDHAWNLLSEADEVVVAKGKKVQVFRPATDDRREIIKACTGRTGNLRAPALRIGNRMIVGFNQEMYERYVGQT